MLKKSACPRRLIQGAMCEPSLRGPFESNSLLALPFVGQGFLHPFAPGKFMHLEHLFKEAHEEFRRALIVLGDSRILAAAALFLLVVLLRACETPPS
jgi:hypothetical protein